MEETKAEQEPARMAPTSSCQPPADAAQLLGTRFVPFVAYTGGRPLSSFDFVFYRRNYSNTLRPFYTVQAPFCGYSFREGTRHIRKKTDLENSDHLKWRSIRSIKI